MRLSFAFANRRLQRPRLAALPGDYQRQLFLVDHAGLPLKTVLEQLDLLGEEVVPVLRKELDDRRPAHVPLAPTHESLKAARDASVEVVR